MVSFDSSALIKCYRDEEHTAWVHALMTEDADWCGSTLLAAEVPIASARALEPTGGRLEVDLAITRDLDAFRLVPIDADCLVRAVDIGRDHRLRTLDAIHLAAAQVLPSACRFVTFDERQRDVAQDLGLEILAPPV